MNKTPKVFPTKIVVGLGLAVLVLGFAGAFGYSFLKSKIQRKMVSTLPGGSTIQTKEEGLATCKLNGTIECYSLVAVSFDDMSVCKQSADKNACEAGAKELKKSFEDSLVPEGNGSDKDSDTDKSDSTATTNDLRECKTGTFFQSVEGKVAVVGKEKISIGGSTYETCCTEGSGELDGEAFASKACLVIEDPDSSIIYEKIDGHFVLQAAQVRKGDQMCTYAFNSEGQQTGRFCE